MHTLVDLCDPFIEADQLNDRNTLIKQNKNKPYNLDIFSYNDNNQLVNINTKAISSFSDHKLNEEEKIFCIEKSKEVNILNKRNHEKFQQEKKSSDHYSKKLNKINEHIINLTKKLNSIKINNSRNDLEMKQLINENKRAKDNYDIFLNKDKHIYVNHIEKREVMPSNLKKYFEGMAEDAYNTIKENILKRNISITKVIREDNKEFIRKSTIERINNYILMIDQFKILYLTYYNNPDFEGLLSISFKMRWLMPGDEYKVKNGILIQRTGLCWKQIEKGLSSYRRSIYFPPDKSWRLPTLTELIILSKIISDKKNDVFSQLDWTIVNKQTCFISSDCFKNKKNETKCNCYNFINNKTEEVDDFEGTNVLWVKQKK